MARGKKDDNVSRSYHNIKISINLGHEVLRERDVLSMIATSVRDKYKAFVKSSKPHLFIKSIIVLIISLASLALVVSIQRNFDTKGNADVNKEVSVNNMDAGMEVRNSPISIREDVSNAQKLVVSGNSDNSNN